MSILNTKCNNIRVNSLSWMIDSFRIHNTPFVCRGGSVGCFLRFGWTLALTPLSRKSWGRAGTLSASNNTISHRGTNMLVMQGNGRWSKVRESSQAPCLQSTFASTKKTVCCGSWMNQSFNSSSWPWYCYILCSKLTFMLTFKHLFYKLLW